MDYNKVAKKSSPMLVDLRTSKGISLCYTFKIDVEGSIIGR